MALGSNRDYVTRDRAVKKNLQRHFVLMQEFIQEGMGREEASEKAFEIVKEENKRGVK